MRGGTEGPLLVLGASGFLGVHLVEAALGSRPERRVVGVARRASSAPLAASARERAELLDADLLEHGVPEGLLERIAPAAVVLAAAIARDKDASADPVAAWLTNRDLAIRVAKACHARGARALYVSTDLVFGAASAPKGGFLEGAPTDPRGVYARTKAEGEIVFRHHAPDGVVLRLPLLFGDSRGRGVGASDALLAALARGERPFLFTDEWRTPLDVLDAAAIAVELVVSGASGVVHAPGPQRLTRATFGERVAAAHGLRAGAFDRGPRAARGAGDRPADTSLGSTRLAALVRHVPLDLDGALARARDAAIGRSP